MPQRGWIKIWRKLEDHELYRDTNAMHVLLDLLITTNRKTGKSKVGRMWSSDRLGMKPSTWRNALERLKRHQIVDIQPNNKYSLVTILNWNQYQGDEDRLEDTDRTTRGQQEDTKQELRIKNKEIIPKGIKAKPKVLPAKKTKMSVITTQDTEGNIKPVMRMNTKGELEPAVYGNREIGLSILAFEEHLGGKTDGTAKSERLYAGHLVKALAKEYPDKDPVELVKQLLKAAMIDPFFAKNCTSFRWLYYNKQKLIQAVKTYKSNKAKGGIVKLYE